MATSGKPQAAQQQVVERRGRQHHAEVRIARRHLRRHRRRRPARQQHDRRLDRGELLRRQVRDLAQLAGLVEVAHHQGERLPEPELALAQARDRGAVARIAHEVEAAQALDRHDASVRQRPRRAGERRVAARERGALRVPERQARPAGRAGDGLRVEAAVARVLVLGPAGRAQDEAAHGRVRAVVGQRAQDGEARAAVGAVGERVAVAPVGRVEHLGQAVRAGRQVRQHQRRPGPGLVAVPDLEGREPRGGQPRGLDALHDGAGRPLGHDPLAEALERPARTLDLDEDPARVVQDPARQGQLPGEAEDEGPEPHALDRPADLEPQALWRSGMLLWRGFHLLPSGTRPAAAAGVPRTVDHRPRGARESPPLPGSAADL